MRYGAPWKWKKLANLTSRVKGLLGDLIDGVKTFLKCKHSFAPGTAARSAPAPDPKSWPLYATPPSAPYA